jgi:hypothetical protein
MSQLEKISLRITGVPGLDHPVELNDIGNVAVVCGQNNSGKTRLLWNLANPGKFEVGVTPTNDVFDNFVRQYRTNTFQTGSFSRCPG